ncbi:MAG: DoxX family protein [Vulcanimicrobiaceae bacterium]
MLPSSRYYATWLAVFRVYAGLFWLSHGVPKFLNSAQYLPPDGFMPQMIAKSVQGTTGFYHDFLVNVVTPNIAVFAELVRVGEVLVGCSLLFGLWTRLGGLCGVFLACNYILAKGGLTSFDAIGGMDAAAFAISFVHLVIPTGRMLGVDALLGRKRNEPVIVPEFVDEPMPQSESPQ